MISRKKPTGGNLRAALSFPLGPTNSVCLGTGAMSAYGTKRTSASALHMSAFRGKADIAIPVATNDSQAEHVHISSNRFGAVSVLPEVASERS